jgi:type IV secretion system protein VirB9
MNCTIPRTAVLVACLAVAVNGAAEQSRATRRTVAQKARPPQAASAPKPAAAEPTTARVVTYSPRDVISVSTRLRYSTLLILPKDEAILDFVCGDKDLWSIEGEQNFAYVKPSTEGSKTNLNLVTASGNVYSFLLTEITSQPGREPDLKVFVEVTDPAMREAVASPKRLVSAKDLDDTRAELERAKAETRQVKQDSREAIDAGISQFVTNVRFAYRFEAGKRPFYVRAMYHDERFTYIQARPEETPTLYEVRDKQPNLINFAYKDGVYVAPKILDAGYLAIGRQRLPFKREE